ncbi:MAG: hypothetical protein ACM3PP_11480 [Candidatus Saccharibacteria bacterium]
MKGSYKLNSFVDVVDNQAYDGSEDQGVREARDWPLLICRKRQIRFHRH